MRVAIPSKPYDLIVEANSRQRSLKAFMKYMIFKDNWPYYPQHKMA